ncbi:MAG: hypothetical protein ACOZQL_02925 [Myxococcota bacterium]
MTSTSAVSCGASGSMCVQCIPGQVCVSGLCASSGAGTNTGGGGGSTRVSDFVGGWTLGGVVQWKNAFGSPQEFQFKNAPMVIRSTAPGVLSFELSSCALSFLESSAAVANAQPNTTCVIPGGFMVDYPGEDGGFGTGALPTLGVVLSQATATLTGNELRLVGSGMGGTHAEVAMTFAYTATR